MSHSPIMLSNYASFPVYFGHLVTLNISYVRFFARAARDNVSHYSSVLVASGVIVCTLSALQNLAGLVTSGFFQGFVTAGFAPCIVVYMQMFYRYDEMALRLAATSWIAELYSTFSRPLLPLIFGMKGWLLAVLFEGIALIATGVATWLLLPDFPQTCKFLTLSSVAAELRLSVLHSKMIIGASTVAAAIFGIASGYQSDRTGERALHVGIPLIFGSSALLLAAVVPGPWCAVETSLSWYGPDIPRGIENPQLNPPEVNVTFRFGEILNENQNHAVLPSSGDGAELELAEIEAGEAVDEFVDNNATKLAYGFRQRSVLEVQFRY
ncbi:hypothetical protein BJ742DRAFT_880183 [Cladochytrium replicatum]|nr:hypothetical protein BJ742DRAFT_880183 [Cladochytrium replicatum]